MHNRNMWRYEEEYSHISYVHIYPERMWKLTTLNSRK